MEFLETFRTIFFWPQLPDSVDVTVAMKEAVLVNRVFFVMIWGAFVVALAHELIYLVRPSRQVKSVVADIDSLGIKIVSKKDDVGRLHEVLSRVQGNLTHCWSEFKDTLIEYHDGSVFNAVDAESFFSAERVRSYLVLPPRLVAELPSLLTAGGILGTFLGLALGLRDLNTTDPDLLAKGVQTLVGGISTAYYTSIWGVTASVLFLIVERNLSGELSKNVKRLVSKIDKLFQRKTEQAILVEMLEHTGELAGTMKSFSTDLSDAVRKALEESVATHLAPHIARMTDLVSSVATHSRESQAEGVKSLVESALGQIGEGITGQVEALSAAMGGAVQDSKEFSSDLRSMLGAMADRTSEQTELAGRFADMLAYLEGQQTDTAEVVKRISDAGRVMSAIADKFGDVHTNVDGMQRKQLEITERTATHLEDIRSASADTAISLNACAAGVDKTASLIMGRADEISSALIDTREWHDRTADNLEKLSDSLVETTRQFDFVSNRAAQAAVELSDVTAGLKTAVAGLAEQGRVFDHASQNLHDSSNQLSSLTNRMDGLRSALDGCGEQIAGAARVMGETWESQGRTVSGLNRELGESMRSYAESVRDSVSDNLAVFDKHLGEATKSLGVVVKELEDTIEFIGDQLERLRP